MAQCISKDGSHEVGEQLTRLLGNTVLFQNLDPLVVQYVLSAYLHLFPSFSTDSTWKAGAAMLLLKRSVYFYSTRQDSVSNTCFVEFTEVNIYMEKKRYFLFPALIHVCQIQRVEENFARLDPLTVCFPSRRQRLQQNTKTIYNSCSSYWTHIEFV